MNQDPYTNKLWQRNYRDRRLMPRFAVVVLAAIVLAGCNDSTNTQTAQSPSPQIESTPSTPEPVATPIPPEPAATASPPEPAITASPIDPTATPGTPAPTATASPPSPTIAPKVSPTGTTENQPPVDPTEDLPEVVLPEDLPEVIGTPPPKPTKSKTSQLLEKKSKELLTSSIGVPVKAIACPNTIELKAGKVYNCQVVTDSGNFTAEIKLNNDRGNFKLNTKGLVVLSKVEQSIDSAIKQKDGVVATTDCGGKRIRAVKRGDVFACQIVTVDGRTKTAKVSVKDEYGNINFKL
ncbi:MAG: DUF4333 domain-containing protein [Cyanosarcina radialis HA8281-LM2]|jgi:hypothetical protein|nr:DUF4333 domain-containing protein [Cyanosarcina radialis HA8281-LM2]